MKCSDVFGFTHIADAVISPAGDAIAYVKRTAVAETDSYQFELFLAPAPGKPWWGIQGKVGEGLRSPAWSPDGRSLAAIEQSEGQVASVVVIAAADGRRQRLVTGAPEPSSVSWSPDGKQIAFLAVPATVGTAWPESPSSLRPAPAVIRNLSAKIDGLGIASSWQRHLLVADRQTGVLRQLTTGDMWVEDYCYTPSDVIAFCGGEPYSEGIPRQPGAVRPCSVWLMSRHGGPATQLTAPDVSARCPVFAASGQVLFVGLPELRVDLPGLFAVPIDGGTPRRLAAALDRGLVTGSAGLDGGHRPVATADGQIFFCARDGGCVQLYRTSLDTPTRIQRIAGSASESIGAVSISHAGESLAYVSTTADGCQRLMIMDLRSGSRTVLADTTPPTEIVTAVPEEFTARDGLKLEGWIIRGRASGPAPLLVDVHGGSFSGAWSPLVQPSRLYQQELASNGWAILLLNSRGSDGYGSKFARAAVGAWGLADAPDFHDAIDTLVGKHLADPARLAVTGYSYGGFMSNWLTATSDRFSAAVAGGSICDFVSLFGTSDMGWVMSVYDIGVHPHRDPVGALRRSPAGISRPVRTPTLLLHGEADLRCPISQAEEWLALLRSSGCEATLVRYPSASHGFLTNGPPSYAADYGNRLVGWITGHIKGGPS